MSRSLHEGPNSSRRPNDLAITPTAATWPCASARVNASPVPATKSVSPERLARNASSAAGGRAETLPRVSWRILPSARKLRRNRCETDSRSSPSLVLYLRTTLATWTALPCLVTSTIYQITNHLSPIILATLSDPRKVIGAAQRENPGDSET